jgi:photosystem II stability/assembly factor-like uncharacterized protein
MKNRLDPRILVILVLVGLLSSPAIPVQAQEGGFSETFEDPPLPGWELSPETSVVDGTLLVKGNGYAFHGGSWQDATFSLRFRIEGSGAGALSYLASDAGSYSIRVSSDGVQLLLDQAGQTLEFGSSPAPVLEGEWNLLTVRTSGEVHTVYLNDEQVYEGTAPVQLPPGGVLLLADATASVFFDDLMIEVNAGPTQDEQPQQNDQPVAGLPVSDMTWVRLGGPPGGLGYDIRMRPDNPDEMYVTDARAGIFKSEDGGANWFASNGNLTFGADEVAPIFCATIDPHHYDTIWIGTQVTGHLYRSDNAGQSWETRDDGISHDARSLRGITIDPNDADVVYVGLEVEAGQWQREHPEATSEMAGGEVYKSTDGGLSWERIWQGPNVARYVWIDPRNSNRVYVSTGIFDRLPANSNYDAGDPGGVGILRSDDAGKSWTVINEHNGLGGRIIPSLFMHPTDPDVLIAAVYGSNISNGIFVTRDGGDTWVQSLDYSLGMHNVEIATSDPDIWYGATEDAFFRSDDAGKTWQKYHLATPDREAGMPIDLQVDPRDPYRIFVNNYGGSNFLSLDGGVTWADASRGYTGAQVNVFILPDDQVVAAAQTGIFLGKDNGFTWVGLKVVDERGTETSPVSDVMLPHDGEVLHSTDGGATWSATEVVDLFAEFEAGRIERDLVSSRLAISPSVPKTVYLNFFDGLCAAGQGESCFDPMPGLYRSLDGGYTWQELEGGPFEEAATLRIVVHPQDPQRLFAATSIGLYKSSDGGDTWQKVDALSRAVSQIAIWDTDNPLAQSDAVIVMDVAFDPFQANTLYASALYKGVFRSDDGGETWQTASYGMDPNEPVVVLLVDVNHSGVLYAGSTLSGVFISTDRAQTWTKISEGLTITSVISLGLTSDSSVLYAGTFNGGAWRLGGEGIPAQEASSEGVGPAAKSTEPETPAGSALLTGKLAGGVAILIVCIVVAGWLVLKRSRGKKTDQQGDH